VHERLCRLFSELEPLEHEAEVVGDVGGVGIDGGCVLEDLLRLLESTELEEDLPLEGAVYRMVTRRLDGASHQEDRSLQVVEVEERL